MSNVFVIINEWTSNDNSTGAEIVDAKFFESEHEAWLALRDIAHSFEDDLDYDATSLAYEDHAAGLQFEEYYIQELPKG